jgi:hypothetical protein
MMAMELRDLNHDQRLGLVALIEAVVPADRRASDEEQDMLAEVVDELGGDDYRSVAAEVDRRFGDEAALKTFLTGLDGDEARELIYGTLLDLAMSDVVSGHEAPLLTWLGRAWELEASFEPDPEAQGE